MGTTVKDSLSNRVLELGRIAGRDLTVLGAATLPDGPVVLSAPTARWDLALMRLADDPMFERGQLDIPVRQRARLLELDKRGITFDELLIAHEVPKNVLSPTPGKQAARDAVARQSAKYIDELGATIGTVAAVGRAAAIGALVVAALPLAALTPLVLADPILIGVLTEGHSRASGTLAVYFEIIRWR